jgi:drug/metabolite transporter (DMT)-like permease
MEASGLTQDSRTHVRRWQADLALVGVTLVWGSTFVVVKQSLESVGPLVFVAARFWTAALTLTLLSLAHRFPTTWSTWRDGAFTGLFLTLGFVTQTIGLQSTEAGKAAFITGLSVVLVPLMVGLLFRARPSRPALVGVGLAAVGLGLLTLNRHLQPTPGDLWVLACAFAFALHIVSTGRFTARHDVWAFTLVQLLTVAVLTTFVAFFTERGALLPPLEVLPAVLYMGVVATALIFGTQTWAQRHTTSTHTALIFSLEPVFAALFAALFAGEVLSLREGVGGALVLGGMLTAELGDARIRKDSISDA